MCSVSHVVHMTIYQLLLQCNAASIWITENWGDLYDCVLQRDRQRIVGESLLPACVFASKISNLATTTIQSAPPPRRRLLSAQSTSLLFLIKFRWLAACCVERHGTTLSFKYLMCSALPQRVYLLLQINFHVCFVSEDCFISRNLLESKWAAIAQLV